MGNKAEQKNIREELEALAPTLSKLKKLEKPVAAPVHYFEQLPTKVLQRLRDDQPLAKPGLQQRWIFWRRRFTDILSQPAYAIALATVAVLIIGLSSLLQNTGLPSNKETALSEEEINKYIDYHLDDFELGLLVEEEAFNPTGTELFLEEDSLDEKAMEDYFDELLDDIDLEELL